MRAPRTSSRNANGSPRRKQQHDRDAVPLLATLIAEQQPDIDDIMRARVERWTTIERKWRNERATAWRRARAEVASLEPITRAAMLRYWNTHRWLPGDPDYLADALHSLRTGRLILADGNIVPARITITAAEADPAVPSRKPVAGGWLGRRTS